MAVLYQKTYQEMVAAHKPEFEEFAKISLEYKKDQEKWQEELDRVGKPLQRIITEYENRLCGKMEGGSKATYTANLADKFRNAIRADYPLIDFVGVKIS